MLKHPLKMYLLHNKAVFSQTFSDSTPSPEKQVSKTVFGNSCLRSDMEMARSTFTTGGLKFKIKIKHRKQVT